MTDVPCIEVVLEIGKLNIEVTEIPQLELFPLKGGGGLRLIIITFFFFGSTKFREKRALITATF